MRFICTACNFIKTHFYSFLQIHLQLPQQILLNISLTIKVAINLDDVYAEATFSKLVLKRQLQFKISLIAKQTKHFCASLVKTQVYFCLTCILV